MSTPISEFRDILRLLLGDNDPNGLYAHADSELDLAVRAVFRMGQAPEGYAVSGMTAIDPSVPDGDAFALISYTAALNLVGGEEGAEAFKTRSLSHATKGERRRDLLIEFRQKIHDIETGGGLVFETRQKLVEALQHLSLGAHTGAEVRSVVTKVTL